MMFRTVLTGLALLGTVGCGSTQGPPDEVTNPDDKLPDISGGQCSVTSVDYPKDGCGFSVGQRIANLSFFGKYNALDAVGQDVIRMTMADFYAMRNQGAKLLFLSGAAEWCGPCNAEADALVKFMADPATQEYMKGYGGPQAIQLLQVVLQNADYSPSDKNTIDRWAKSHKVPYDLGIDPTSKISTYIPSNSIPQSMYIRLSDMKIMYREIGYPGDEAAAAKLKSYLAAAAK